MSIRPLQLAIYFQIFLGGCFYFEVLKKKHFNLMLQRVTEISKLLFFDMGTDLLIYLSISFNTLKLL